MTVISATKKPVTISAILWTGKNQVDVYEFLEGDRNASTEGDNFKIDLNGTGTCCVGKLIIKTLEGDMLANIGDYIIKGVRGEFYPCKPGIFAMTYDVGAVSMEKLLREILIGGQLLPAPTKTTRTPDHQILTVGIGSDNYATIIIHDDAIKEMGL